MTALETRSEEVALTGIGAALGALWQRCRPEDEEVSLSRALTMNFVAVTDCDTEQCLGEALGDLLQRHPCRAFLVSLDDTCSELTAKVSGTADRQGRCQEIVLEKVWFRGALRHFPNLAGIVRPLLVNDIPTHLYWATCLPEDLEAVRLLARMADHCVLDSALFGEPRRDLPRLQTLADRGQKIDDLTWLRIRPWRRALAEALERFRWQAAEPTEITVRHGPGRGALAAGLRLADWLEQRLAARVDLEEVEAPERSDPESLELRHGGVEVGIAHAGDARLRVEVSLPDRCLLPFTVPASRGSAGRLLAAAIDLA